MRPYDCFTDKRRHPVTIIPRRTPKQQAFIVAQWPPRDPPGEPFTADGIEDAARAWLAHVDAGRIGGGV